ncbi:uncharacterized protein BO95DRAFT_188862 [Aspergillus brunneoviolaceus CBS 621.78]|uniref:Uncharacterized protein n=1 Tax=Aspergillus brunneoviolaceus CBS 621.78 TaxID=1450534 RepID=A0ACD1G3Z7_9EURO|nr:hypothetical protein BO95DRAFT_188862 [Aspergillus brunneoviolaceus CBS 621.78]RAH43993.1 hypothetical protein BO95DRAFT_188862 [Aspergillus brunneoviolaceus CBS 621.78]
MRGHLEVCIQHIAVVFFSLPLHLFLQQHDEFIFIGAVRANYADKSFIRIFYLILLVTFLLVIITTCRMDYSDCE